MSFNRTRAAKLLSAKELELFEHTLHGQAQELGDRELASILKRVRTQRDKYQDLFRRQRVSSRGRSGGKDGPRGSDNLRTQQKVEAFSEALARLEKLQKQRERAAAKSATADPRPANWREAKPAVGARPQAARTRRSAERPASQAAPGVPHAKRMQAMGQKRPLAHVSARGRRNQARRDSR